LHRQGHLDRLEVVVEGRNGTADPAQAQACSRDLAHHVKAMIGVSVHVRVESEGAIERSLGKAKRVVDFRSKE
jgi:phenylacetate-CoA ligase